GTWRCSSARSRCSRLFRGGTPRELIAPPSRPSPLRPTTPPSRQHLLRSPARKSTISSASSRRCRSGSTSSARPRGDNVAATGLLGKGGRLPSIENAGAASAHPTELQAPASIPDRAPVLPPVRRADKHTALPVDGDGLAAAPRPFAHDDVMAARRQA